MPTSNLCRFIVLPDNKAEVYDCFVLSLREKTGALELILGVFFSELMSSKLHRETILVKSVGCRASGRPVFGDLCLYLRLFPSCALYCPVAPSRENKLKEKRKNNIVKDGLYSLGNVFTPLDFFFFHI